MFEARQVVVTDYPDADLVDNLAHNVAACAPLFSGGHAPARVSVMGFRWGADPAALLNCLVGAGDASPAPASQAGFDLLILADLVFNHSEHGALLATLKATLRRGEAARALVFFTPHRPWLMERDVGFLERCRGEGLLVRGVGEWVGERVMFEGDRGDERLRRTVFGFEVRWGVGDEPPGEEDGAGWAVGTFGLG